MVFDSSNVEYVLFIHWFADYLKIPIGRALDYRTVIDDFVAKNKDLRPFELGSADWDGIRLVTGWLKAFRSATTQMSAIKQPMLSTTHAIFCGLQDNIRQILRDLPDSVPDQLKLGLTDAHCKLSDYYYKFDESPYYTWAARTYPSHFAFVGLPFNWYC